MALSQPLSTSVKQKGQIALLCQLCENEQKLKWKCLDCGFMICQRCRDKVHSKFPLAEDHTIIDIKDISKHQTDPEPKLELTRIKCQTHTNKMCCMYCTTCHELVCQTCIAKTHNKHNFCEINDEYQAKVEKVKERLRAIQRGKVNLTIREKKLKQIKSAEQSNYETVKQDMLDYKTALVNEIKTHTEKLLKDLDQKWEACLKIIQNEKQILQEKQDEIQKQMQDISQILQPNNAKDVFFVSDFLFAQPKIHPLNKSFNGVPKFSYGDKINVPLIIGKLKDVVIQYNIDLKMDKAFETDLKCIYNVSPSPDGSLWIGDMESDFIQKVKQNGDDIIVITKLKAEVLDTAILPSGDLLLSQDSSNLKLVPHGSTDIQDSTYTVSPLYTSAVHVTHDNKVIVGAGSGSSILPADGPDKVIVMNQTGRHEKVFQYDRLDKPLFTLPFRITSNSQGNIALIDIVSDDNKGRVLVLDQEGKARNIYTGHPDVNNEDNPFTPIGITATPSDNFVVADSFNHTLHILNNEGVNITFYNTKEMGILLPCSLAFSSTGQLYIGSYEKEKGKLFKVNNFFF